MSKYYQPLLLLIMIGLMGINLYQVNKINHLQNKLEILEHRIGETYLNTKFNNRILKKHTESDQNTDHHNDEEFDTISLKN